MIAVRDKVSKVSPDVGCCTKRGKRASEEAEPVILRASIETPFLENQWLTGRLSTLLLVVIAIRRLLIGIQQVA